METPTLAELRAADADIVYSLHFPDGGRVAASAAAAVGCVCLDYLTCSECERILGQSFLAVELAVRKKQRTGPPAPVARVDAGPEQGPRARAELVRGRGVRCSGPSSYAGPKKGGQARAGLAPTVRQGRGVRRGGNLRQGGPVRAGIAPTGGRGRGVRRGGKADRHAPGSNGGVEATISGMAARLGLAAAVGERAEELFRKMEEAKAWPRHPSLWGKDRNRVLLYAACISVACRSEGSARSLRELALATANGVGAAGAATRSEIARLIAHIRRRLGEDEAGQGTGIGMVCASSYVHRFAELIRLGEAEKAAALEAARRVGEGVLDVRHKPASVAAAAVCLALERAGASEPGVLDVAAAGGISQSTIHEVCKKMRPHAERLFG